MPPEVTALRRYPVKSLLGEDLPAAEVTPRGLRHDRGLALLDRESGKVASAKHPRLWRELLQLTAAVVGPAVRITLPDGKTLWNTDADIDTVLSGWLGRPVTLTDVPPPVAALDRAEPEEVLRSGVTAEVPVEIGRLGAGSPDGTFFDYAPVHLLTSSALALLAELSPRGTAEPERYRPNIVIGGAEPGFAENAWQDRELHIGDELVLRVTALTPRCAVPTLAHGGLPRDTDALRIPAVHNRVVPFDDRDPQPCVGAYARVLRPGTIRVGDVVRPA